MFINEAVLNFQTNSLTVSLESAEHVQTAYDRLRNDPPQTAVSVTVENIWRPIEIMWRAGHKIDALKLYRAVTLEGLKESKEACEKIGGSPLRY
jgi:ribosomal protein L7/L12